MSNGGFKGPKQWLQLLKLDNFVHIHVKNENDPWCVLTSIYQLLLDQNWKSRTVLKSSGQADFKTDLPFWIWWRFDGDIDTKQTGVFFCGHPVEWILGDEGEGSSIEWSRSSVVWARLECFKHWESLQTNRSPLFSIQAPAQSCAASAAERCH